MEEYENKEYLVGGERLRLVKIVKSHNKLKKYDAVFLTRDGREKVVSFGATGYSDFTQHHDEDRKARYLERHGRGHETWSRPDTPGALSRWVLWNKKGFRASVADFKRRFRL